MNCDVHNLNTGWPRLIRRNYTKLFDFGKCLTYEKQVWFPKDLELTDLDLWSTGTHFWQPQIQTLVLGEAWIC